MEYVIGVCDNHDSGACLFENSNLMFAINEERINREKLTRMFPIQSFNACLSKIPKNQRNNVNVAYASHMTPIALLRKYNKPYSGLKKRSQFSYSLNAYFMYQILLKKLNLTRIESNVSKKIISNKLSIKNIRLYDHHACHAYSAYSYSGFDKALVITVDAMGDGITLTVNIGDNNRIRRIYQETGSSSISLYYSRITELLGFKAIRHEGKILGLAAYGNPDKTLRLMNKLLFYNGKGGFNKLNHLIPVSKNKGIFRKLKKYKRKDVAAGLQKNLESEFIKFLQYWVKKTQIKNVCVAGGIFANVKLNQRIHENIDKFFVFPHMGDGGLAVGAALAYIKPNPNKITNLFLGPDYTDKQMKAELEKSNLNYKKLTNPGKEIANLLAKGNVIAYYNDRMEYGPRALGNRSVLYRPDDKTVNDWLNKKLKRTEFMPFAPVVLEEDANKCFKNIKGAEHAAKFMTITFDCTEWMKYNCQGVLHVDGTARPQLINKKDNPVYYNIIKEFKKLTKLPCIINTSFNIHEQPIVCTPKDAIRAFVESELDYLVLGDYLVK